MSGFPRILFLDAYDSFTNNIVALIQQELGAKATVIHIDHPAYLGDSGAFKELLEEFDAVIAGPGPGNPNTEADVGLINRLWTLEGEDILPVLGICLGFQSLCLAFGGSVTRLKQPRHGTIHKITHNHDSIFASIRDMEVTQYHSLKGVIPKQGCSLQALAWDNSDSERNGSILMAVRHVTHPFWGVQYHPESICTNAAGKNIIKNWWYEAAAWLARKGRQLHSPPDDAPVHFDGSFPNLHQRPVPLIEIEYMQNSTKRDGQTRRTGVVQYTDMPLGRRTVLEISKLWNASNGEVILLESGTKQDGMPVRPDTGRYSIIGVLSPDAATYIHWYQDSKILEVRDNDALGLTKSSLVAQDAFGFLTQFVKERQATGGEASLPFWGGLMGFISYEAGLHTIAVDSSSSTTASKRPDISFAYVERSIVVDHVEGRIWIQSIKDNDFAWLRKTKLAIGDLGTHLFEASQESCLRTSPSLSAFPPTPAESEPSADQQLIQRAKEAIVDGPCEAVYRRRVEDCQSLIRAGESYELCLTDQTQVHLPAYSPNNSALSLYQSLRKLNPAPFSAFMRLGQPGQSVQIVSSSPERFLSWNREGKCQFRPIKGTVKKTPSITRADAEAILNSPKERAENLMIVDLIRHDLHGVAGAGNVQVTKLMGIEEYETVYQLVSVIEGQLPAGDDKTGIHVLAASLPPGSMTGAPKKRSCELLTKLEDGKPRGLYSGVLGYLDVGGGGDFSVVIRTAFHWDDDVVEIDRALENGEVSKVKHDTWRIGAGGAVTALSDPEGEWKEMLAKRDSILRMFGIGV